MRERDMRPAVMDWCYCRGWSPVCEVYVKSHTADMISVAYGGQEGRLIPEVKTLVGIELKLRDITGVIRQCESLKWWCHAVYAAMPKEFVDRMKPETPTKFKSLGIGLLSVDGNQVSVEVNPSRPCYPATEHVETLRRRLWRRIKSGQTHVTDEQRDEFNRKQAEYHDISCDCKYCLPTKAAREAEREANMQWLIKQGQLTL